MSSSIQRAGAWWNQAPDGTWLKWSQESATWIPQEGAPPPPGSPPPPPAPPSVPGAETTPVSAGAQQGSAAPETQASQARASVEEGDPTDSAEEPVRPPASNKANAPIFSESRRRMGSPLENKTVVGVAAAALVIFVFVATYMGANVFFRNAYGTEIALAGEKAKAPPTSRAKQLYIDRLDRLCANDRTVAGFEKKLLAVDSPAEMNRLFAEMRGKLSRQLDRWEGIKKPSQDRRLLERILRLHRQVIPFMDRMLAAVQSRDVTGIETLAAEAYANAAKAKRLMGEYGFEICGRI